jgi:hypothetical protein
MATRFDQRAGFKKDAPRESEILTVVGRIAEAVADEARSNTDSHRYRDGIKVEVGDDEHGDPVGRVNATWFASGFIEFGTSQQNPDAPLRHALDSAVGGVL